MGWKEHRLKEKKKNQETIKQMLMKAGLSGLKIKDMNCDLSRQTLYNHLYRLEGTKKVRQEWKRWIWNFPVTNILKAKLDILYKNEIFVRGLFQDRRFKKLVLQKLCEGFQVREDIKDAKGNIIDIKIFSFGGKDLIEKSP